MKLKPFSSREVLRILSKLGFKVVRRRGSHIVLKGFFKDKVRTVVVPWHDEIAFGTLRGVLFQAGLTTEEFLKLVEKS